MERLAVGMGGDLKGDAGRTVQLGNNDALSAIDDERAALGYHGDLTHVNLFVLNEVLFTQAQLHIKGNRVGYTFANTLDFGVLGITESVGDVFENQPSVVGLDREYLAEDSL